MAKKPTFKKLLPEIVDELEWRARDNARNTEGVPRGSDGIEFYQAYQDSVISIIQSFNSPKEFNNYDSMVKLGRPLEGSEVQTVLRLCWGFTKDGKPAAP